MLPAIRTRISATTSVVISQVGIDGRSPSPAPPSRPVPRNPIQSMRSSR